MTLHERQMFAAQLANEAVRLIRAVMPGSLPWPRWEDQGKTQEHVFAAVRRVWEGATPQDLHEGWRDDLCADGWVAGPVLDHDAKLHPLLVDYESLPFDQRQRDAVFHDTVVAAQRMTRALDGGG